MKRFTAATILAVIPMLAIVTQATAQYIPSSTDKAFVRAVNDTSPVMNFSGAHHISAVFFCRDTIDVTRLFQYRITGDTTWNTGVRDSVVSLAATGRFWTIDEFTIRSAVADSVITGGGDFRIVHLWKDHANNANGGRFSEWIRAK
jgi:hypothetical protein